MKPFARSFEKTTSFSGRKSESRRESAASPEDRERTFFERRELRAQTMARFFRAMKECKTTARTSTTEIINSADEALEILLSSSERGSLDPATQDALADAWEAWRLRSRETSQKLLKILLQEKAKRGTEYRGSRVGNYLFEYYCHKKPHGSVAFIKKGPFINLRFYNPYDYQDFTRQFHTNRQKNAQEYIESLPTPEEKGARRLRMEKEAKISLDSDGLFMSHTRWNGETVPTTISLATPWNPTLTIEEHEDQHFINHCIGGYFSRWEREKNGKLPETANVGRAVKDEILAFIASNNTKVLRKSFFVNVYSQHYLDLTPEERKTVQDQLGKITDVLQRHPWIFSAGPFRKNLREMMVTNLLDVPFEQMDRYLERSAAHYRRQIAGLVVPDTLSWFGLLTDKKTRARDGRRFYDQYLQAYGLDRYELSPPNDENIKPKIVREIVACVTADQLLLGIQKNLDRVKRFVQS